jgi:hypothetical protein
VEHGESTKKSDVAPRNDDELAQALLDDDAPARVRKTFVGITATAGVVCLLPRQWISAAICFAVALVLFVVHRVKLAREARAAEPSSG